MTKVNKNILFQFFKSGIFIVIILLSGCMQKRPWTHMELGAGNYGNDGHTKIALRKTILKEFTYVSNAKNFVDDLPEKEDFKYAPNHQFAVLFLTLDKLVAEKGRHGIFHVNDLYAEYANAAVKQLRKYARKQRYTGMRIAAISGDYLLIDPKKTLSRHHLTAYDSVHLKNPEVSFYNYGMDGDNMLSNEASRQKARAKLQTLANLSYDGLYFFPIDHSDVFIPKAEKEQFIKKGTFYHLTTKWEALAYYFPEGKTIDKQYGQVYFIKRL